MNTDKDLDIKVLSGGCSSCSQLYANVEEAIDALEIDCQPEFIYDIEKALKYEVFQMPALIINEKVVSTGSDLDVEKVKALIEKALAE